MEKDRGSGGRAKKGRKREAVEKDGGSGGREIKGKKTQDVVEVEKER